MADPRRAEIQRAYGILSLKALNDAERAIEGIATTITPDRMGDIVDPKGASFKLPLPLLWQHDSHEPIGWVTSAKTVGGGIQIAGKLATTPTAGIVKDSLDKAWEYLKLGLVRGLSIGFRGLDVEDIPNSWSVIFKKWEWLELSAVTIPANAEASITTIRSLAGQQAASGQSRSSVQVILPPGVSGKASATPIHGKQKMKTPSQYIAELEPVLVAKQARFDEITEKAAGAGRSPDDAEKAECSELMVEISATKSELELWRFKEAAAASTATPIVPRSTIDATGMRLAGQRTFATVKAAKPEPGIRVARIMRVKALAHEKQADVLRIAEAEYNGRDPWVVEFFKANEVNPLMTGALGDGLIPAEVGLGDFAEYLRPMTILGQFGTNGIPALRAVPFRSGLASVTVGSTSNWVAEANPKPLTFIDTARNHLLPLKVATIIAISLETLRDSSPAAEGLIRDEIAAAVVEKLDQTFIDPAVTANSGVNPASITNDQDSIASTGTDVEDVLLDLRSLFAKFDAANNRASQAVLVMSTGNARALAFMQNNLGGQAFPSMRVNGGNLQGVPVIASDYAGDNVVLISAGDVLVAREGGVEIKMSTEASLEMKEYGHLTQHGSPTATGVAMVSLWQNNMAAFLAEQTMNWVKRRDVVAPYLTDVAWGGAVPVS